MSDPKEKRSTSAEWIGQRERRAQRGARCPAPATRGSGWGMKRVMWYQLVSAPKSLECRLSVRHVVDCGAGGAGGDQGSKGRGAIDER